MTDNFAQNQQQQFVERLLRESPGLNESAFVSSTGGKTIGFVAKVISKYDYNYYNVKAVEVDIVGTLPTIVGNQVIAVNVAESFTAQGMLPAGSFVIIFKIADLYVFHAPV
jgi:hypothetical protein